MTHSLGRTLFALLSFVLGVAAFIVLVREVGGKPLLPQDYPSGTVIIGMAAIVSVLALAGAARLLTAPPPARSVPRVMSETRLALLAAPWIGVVLLAALVAAAVQSQPRLFSAALSLPAALFAALTGRVTMRLLANPEEKLELRRDILGVGGGLGGWRISRSLGAALLTVLLCLSALSLAISAVAGSTPSSAVGDGNHGGDRR